jgi:hypothetical protein
MSSADKQRAINQWIDAIFTAVYLMSFCLLIVMSIASFRQNKKMVSLPNMLIVVFLLGTLLSKSFGTLNFLLASAASSSH